MEKKVLHVISRLDPGGVESWLINTVLCPTRSYANYILCASGASGVWARRISAEFVLTHPNYKKGKLCFLWALWKELGGANYDVVHTHVYRFSFFIAIIAKLRGCKVIAHSHTNKDVFAMRKGLKGLSFMFARRLYQLGFKLCDARVAASEDAGRDLFGNDYHVVHCGVYMASIKSNVDCAHSDTPIRLTTVGSLLPVKNHTFLLDVCAELAKRKLEYELNIIGVGRLREELEAKARSLNIIDNIVFHGTRNDVFDFLMSSSDVFLFPSLYEGLGLAYVEAQAAGLQCIISEKIPYEADVARDSITRLPLICSEWAGCIENIVTNNPIKAIEANQMLVKSDFNIEISVMKMESIYSSV